MANTNVQNEVKRIAQAMESLAHEIQIKLDAGDDIMVVSNELVRNNSTFVFTLGEFYALKRSGTSRKVKARTVSTPTTPRNYHNLRDSRGRFTPKV